ncbi:MAG: phosphoglucosamine mutase, partial [Clostridia bacterium]
DTKLLQFIQSIEAELGKNCRILVRASGTEQKLRIMTECCDQNLAIKVANDIKEFIEKTYEI